MRTTVTTTVELTKLELQEILSKHFGRPIIDVVEKMETYGWSGQVWDDGPQCEQLCGLTVKFK